MPIIIFYRQKLLSKSTCDEEIMYVICCRNRRSLYGTGEFNRKC